MKRIVSTTLMLLVLAFVAGPILWVVLTSLKPESEILRLPVVWFPSSISWEHYGSVLGDPAVHRYILNSFGVAVATSVLATLLGALAAYGFGRYRFPGRSFVLGLLLVVHLLPNLVSMTALYRICVSFHLLNSLAGLVLVKAAGLSLVVWLLKGYFESLPPEYEEMARVDGCGPLGVFFRVVVPLRIRGILVTGLFFFAQSWKSFFLPLLLINRKEKMTLPLGIYQYVGEHGFEIGKICALSVISMVPILFLLFVLNRIGWESLRPSG
jgi:ABC-type glycerol-3-phosphate transport system permease component